MNKKLISLSLVLASSLLLAGCTKQSTPTSQTPAKTVSEAAEFENAIKSGKPATCTMTKGEDSMEYLMKGKMMKANIKTTVEGKVMISQMINDTKYLYVWDDKTKQGSKMAVPTEEETNAMTDKAEVTPKLESQADYDNFKNDGYTIDCKSGNVDDSVFVPPIDVKFIDPSAMMKAIPSPAADGKYDMSKIEELQKQYGGDQ